jgi:cytochrome c oxidase subunit 3
MTDTFQSDPSVTPKTRPGGWAGVVSDWSADQRALKSATWRKAMIWFFLLSDTFIFSIFLLSYMTARMSTKEPWPNSSEVFSLHIGHTTYPLLLIAIMTFVLISSSGTMVLAVNYGYRKDRKLTAIMLLVTALLGVTFVGMQAFEWTKLIQEGVRPWGNPMGAPQFGAIFFMITGFHGTHVLAFLQAARANTNASKSWACIGILSISFGFSFLHFSIFGKEQTWHIQTLANRTRLLLGTRLGTATKSIL